MAHEHDVATVQDVVEVPSRPQVTDELRSRMRLRLATNSRRERDAQPDAGARVEPEAVVLEPMVEPVVVPVIVAAIPVPVTVGSAAAADIDPLVGMIVPRIPKLSQPSRAAASVRLTQALPTPTIPVTPRNVKASHSKNRKRSPFRAFFTLLIVVGMLGGAAYAGWYYFLRNQVTWAKDVEPLAAFVEKALHREFTEKVTIETLPVADYGVKLGLMVLQESYADPDGSLTALRAVGVAGPSVSPDMVGNTVASIRTSFYDPSDSVIYRLGGTSPLFEYSLVRSLSAALIDQQIGWSKNFDMLTDSQQVGLLAIVNSVSDDVAAIRSESTISGKESATIEVISRLQAVGFNPDSAPVYVIMAVWRDFLDVSRYPVPSLDDPLAGLAAPPSDAVVFDVTRDPLTAPITVAAPGTSELPPRTLGMQFWYAAMVPALGPEAARAAALLWAGDTSVLTMVDNFACMNANIATASAADQTAMSAALMQWGQTRPASSMALIASQPGNITSVAMCEPAEGSTDKLGDTTIMQLHALASSEAEVARALLTIGLPDTRTAWNCAALARRSGALIDYEPDTVDQAVIASMNDVVTFCSG